MLTRSPCQTPSLTPTPRASVLRSAFLSFSSFENVMHAGYNAYDQYEVAIPVAKVGDCMSALTAAMYGSGQLWRGFRSPALIRFISGEGWLGRRLYFRAQTASCEPALQYKTPCMEQQRPGPCLFPLA